MAALVRDEGKLQSYKGSQATKTSIDIYSCAGKLIRQIKVRKDIYDMLIVILTRLVGQRLDTKFRLV